MMAWRVSVWTPARRPNSRERRAAASGSSGFGDEHEVVPAEDHVAGEEGGAGYGDLLGDVVNEVGVVDQLLLAVGGEGGEEYVKHGVSRRVRVWGIVA